MKTTYRNIIISLLIFCSYDMAFAQGQANIWYFGSGNGLDFNYTPPLVLENGNTNLGGPDYEGGGGICDVNGALLFYTDGMEVFDKNHNEMPSTVTANLNGGTGTSTQTGMVLPVNGSTTQYFIFSTNGAESTYYSVVDMTLNGGLGDVVAASKNTQLVATGASEAAVAIPEYDASNNPTGESWIVFHDHSSNNYRVYKTNGATVTFSASYAVGFSPTQRALVLKTNACFDKIAISFYNHGRVEILPFNNKTGVVSAPSLILWNTTGTIPFLNVEVYGIEFSPNDQFLYVTEGGLNDRRTIYQFNIGGATGTNPAAVLSSRSYFTADATITRFGQAQLGPDGKIYLPGWNASGTTWICCIPTPNVAWAAATPTATEFQNKLYTYTYVGNRIVGQGLPLFSQALLRQIKIYVTNACEAEPANFSYTFGGGAVSQTWNFGDPGSGALNTSTDLAPSHTYNLAGNYTVTLDIVDNCGRTRQATTTIIIKSGPVVSVPTTACPNQDVVLTGTGTNAAAYIWSLNASMTPSTGPSSTYTYNGALPATVYVKDPTPIANYTVGNTGASATAGADVGHTYFELLTTVTLTEFQVTARLNGQNANFTIQSENLATTYYTVAAPLSVASTTYTFNPNVVLAPGRYVLRTSNVGYAFRNNTSNDGGRDVPGVIDVLGEKHATLQKGGSFFNIKLALPDPCGVRAYTITENCPLPVSWLAFAARLAGDEVALTWTVASENNNDHFVVQVSHDGVEYIDLGVVNGRGTASTRATYSFNDLNPSDINHYRIKQVDYNGDVSYSTVETVYRDNRTVTLQPNPFSNEVNISFSDHQSAHIEVTDVMGRILEYSEKPEGTYTHTVGSALPPGTYIVRIFFVDKIWSIPVVKK